MACKCGCGFDSMDIETLRIADEVRDLIEKPITPSSACRCRKHNTNIGGSLDSQHTKARAIDLPLENPKRAYIYLCSTYYGKYGFGLYSWGIHIDTRTGRAARWEE